jgi:hypothetical protein
LLQTISADAPIVENAKTPAPITAPTKVLLRNVIVSSFVNVSMHCQQTFGLIVPTPTSLLPLASRTLDVTGNWHLRCDENCNRLLRPDGV